MSKQIIGLTGYAGSGKDTAAANMPGWTRVAFADPIRELAMEINPIIGGIYPNDFVRLCDVLDGGWNVAKNYYEVRRLLQRLGTEAGRRVLGENIWIDLAMRKADAIDGPVVVTDVRFLNEADAIRERGGKVFRIDRLGVGPVNDHISDTGVDSITVDCIIPNDTDPKGLGKAVMYAAEHC